MIRDSMNTVQIQIDEFASVILGKKKAH